MLIDPLKELYYRLPQGLQRAVLVKRRERIWIDAGILFIHVPKAAGTSINLALYGRFIGHVRASDVARWGSARLKSLPSFAVTRNPWDRLVSAYRFARRLRTKDWKSDARVPRAVRSQVPEFESFASFVTDWLAHRDVRSLNQIFQPQSLFVCDPGGKVLVDHVGRLDDLAPTVDFLHRLGIAPAIEQTNLSGEPVDYRSYYTPELAALVGRIYAEDVGIFGYDFGTGSGAKAGSRAAASRQSAQ